MSRGRDKHFVGYHNFEKMEADRGDEEDVADEADAPRWGFLTKKNPDQFIGGVVWWITGEGQPRQYFLDGWFVVEGVETVSEARFESRIHGHTGATFQDDAILLNEYDWFKGFREAQGNFGLGIQPIQPQHLDGIVAAVREAGLPLPPGA